ISTEEIARTDVKNKGANATRFDLEALKEKWRRQVPDLTDEQKPHRDAIKTEACAKVEREALRLLDSPQDPAGFERELTTRAMGVLDEMYSDVQPEHVGAALGRGIERDFGSEAIWELDED